jgi:hypothetical protein
MAEPKLAEIASRINAHLKRFERDRSGINKLDSHGLQPYYNAGAFPAGRYVGVCYINYQGVTNLTKADALKYLAKLDAGYVGRHWDALRGKPEQP